MVYEKKTLICSCFGKRESVKSENGLLQITT